MESVDATGALGLLDDEAGLLEQPQVPRDRRAADGQGLRELADRPAVAREELDDGAPMRVPEGIERVAAQRFRHPQTVTGR